MMKYKPDLEDLETRERAALSTLRASSAFLVSKEEKEKQEEEEQYN